MRAALPTSATARGVTWGRAVATARRSRTGFGVRCAAAFEPSLTRDPTVGFSGARRRTSLRYGGAARASAAPTKGHRTYALRGLDVPSSTNRRSHPSGAPAHAAARAARAVGARRVDRERLAVKDGRRPLRAGRARLLDGEPGRCRARASNRPCDRTRSTARARRPGPGRSRGAPPPGAGRPTTSQSATSRGTARATVHGLGRTRRGRAAVVGDVDDVGAGAEDHPVRSPSTSTSSRPARVRTGRRPGSADVVAAGCSVRRVVATSRQRRSRGRAVRATRRRRRSSHADPQRSRRLVREDVGDRAAARSSAPAAPGERSLAG